MVQFEPIVPGQPGAPTPQPGQTAVVHYVGTFPDGRKFDSSRDRGEPFTFRLGVGEAIRGYDEAVFRMSKGQRSRFTIQPGWAYGEAGAGDGVPPNSILCFDIELLDFY